MVNPDNVRPTKWTNVKPLFNDGDFSAISGHYENGSQLALGIRWNGAPDNDKDKGYPKSFDHPGWFVVPDFLVEPMLLKMLSETERTEGRFGNRDNLLFALRMAAIQLQPGGIRYAIALYGAANSGKTMTLNFLIDMLVEAAIGNNEGIVVEVRCGYNPDTKIGDRRVAIRVFGKTVVVATGGDDPDAVKAGFDFAVRLHADIYVSAAHKRSNSYGWAEYVKNIDGAGIPHVDIKKEWVADPTKAADLAVKTAVDLFTRIKGL